MFQAASSLEMFLSLLCVCTFLARNACCMFVIVDVINHIFKANRYEAYGYVSFSILPLLPLFFVQIYF